MELKSFEAESHHGPQVVLLKKVRRLCQSGTIQKVQLHASTQIRSKPAKTKHRLQNQQAQRYPPLTTTLSLSFAPEILQRLQRRRSTRQGTRSHTCQVHREIEAVDDGQSLQ